MKIKFNIYAKIIMRKFKEKNKILNNNNSMLIVPIPNAVQWTS